MSECLRIYNAANAIANAKLHLRQELKVLMSTKLKKVTVQASSLEPVHSVSETAQSAPTDTSNRPGKRKAARRDKASTDVHQQAAELLGAGATVQDHFQRQADEKRRQAAAILLASFRGNSNCK